MAEAAGSEQSSHRIVLLSEQGLRLDGRRRNELRTIKCNIGSSTTAEGSFYLEQGLTKVRATVRGPHQASKAKMLQNQVVLNCQYGQARLATAGTVSSGLDHNDEEKASELKQALLAVVQVELHPKSQIDVNVEVLQDDGGAFCVAVNAACLALIDAGIPLRSYVCACTAGLVIKDGRPDIVLDVNLAEQGSGIGVLTVASLPRTRAIALLSISHKVHLDHFDALMSVAMRGCEEIMTILDKAVLDKLTKNLVPEN